MARQEVDETGKKHVLDARFHPLTVGLSHDGGMSWPFVRDLEEDYDAKLEYSYPSVVQTSDGWIHITHTWSQAPCRRCAIRYQRIDEDWVKQTWAWGSTRWSRSSALLANLSSNALLMQGWVSAFDSEIWRAYCGISAATPILVWVAAMMQILSKLKEILLAAVAASQPRILPETACC
eukprot:scaffold168241_cov44-Prasinocladus_malaysianus.AAC.1